MIYYLFSPLLDGEGEPVERCPCDEWAIWPRDRAPMFARGHLTTIARIYTLTKLDYDPVVEVERLKAENDYLKRALKEVLILDEARAAISEAVGRAND